MKIFFPPPLPDRPEIIIRRAGYTEHRDSQTNETSYTKRLGPEFYPRFHVYLEEKSGGLSLNLHLDQKKPSYIPRQAHAGEYEGTVVEREADRLRVLVTNYENSSDSHPASS